jgi:hypothetical protein
MQTKVGNGTSQTALKNVNKQQKPIYPFTFLLSGGIHKASYDKLNNHS